MKSILKQTDDTRVIRARGLIKNVAEITVLVGLYITIFKVFGKGIPCMFRMITGFKCPGCGMTHALSALVDGNIWLAIEYNALSVSVLPLLLIFGAVKTVKYINCGEEEFTVTDILLMLACLGISIVYSIHRNGFM